MGSSLSAEERKIYLPVKNALLSSKLSFSKRELKDFIKWSKLSAPWLQENLVHQLNTWNKIGIILAQELKYDKLRKSNFATLLLKIQSAMRTQLPSSFSSPSPSSLNSSSPFPKPCRSASPCTMLESSPYAPDSACRVGRYKGNTRTPDREMAVPNSPYPSNSYPHNPSFPVGNPTLISNSDHGSNLSVNSWGENAGLFRYIKGTPPPCRSPGILKYSKMADGPCGDLSQCGKPQDNHLRERGTRHVHFSPLPSHTRTPGLSPSATSTDRKFGHALLDNPTPSPPPTSSNPFKSPPTGGRQTPTPPPLFPSHEGRNPYTHDITLPTPDSTLPPTPSYPAMFPETGTPPDSIFVPTGTSSQEFPSLESNAPYPTNPFLPTPSQSPTIVAPVHYSHNNPKWKPFSLGQLKEITKSSKDFGLNSPQFKMTLEAIFEEYLMTPHDLKRVFGGLLETPELRVWEKLWQSKLEDVVVTCKSDLATSHLTIQHLMGEGEFSPAQRQAELIPKEILRDIKSKALTAFFEIPLAGIPTERWASMMQMPGENIAQFVKRLEEALTKEFEDPVSRTNTLISLLRSNSSKACRQEIATLPKRPKPTLGDIIEVCMPIPPDPIPPPFNPKKHLQNFPTTAAVPVPPVPERRCFNCGKTGHLIKNCPFPPKTPKTPKNLPSPLDSFPGTAAGNTNKSAPVPRV